MTLTVDQAIKELQKIKRQRGGHLKLYFDTEARAFCVHLVGIERIGVTNIAKLIGDEDEDVVLYDDYKDTPATYSWKEKK